MRGSLITASMPASRAWRDGQVIQANTTVPMWATNIDLTKVGPFEGGMVVSMRPIPEDQVDLAFQAAYHRLSARINAFLALPFETMKTQDLLPKLAKIGEL